MNAMNTKSIFLLLLLCAALLPAYGQSLPSTKNGAGGEILDEKAHIEAKNKWIQENPEAYRKAGGDPAAVNGASNSVFVDNSTAKTAAPASNFQAVERYAVLKTEAVPLKGKTVSAEQLKVENQGLAQEYPAGKVEIQRDAKGKLRIFSADKLNLVAVETRAGNQLTWSFGEAGCVECVKAVRLNIEEESPAKVVYLMQSEDEGAAVSYRLTLQPIQQR